MGIRSEAEAEADCSCHDLVVEQQRLSRQAAAETFLSDTSLNHVILAPEICAFLLGDAGSFCQMSENEGYMPVGSQETW